MRETSEQFELGWALAGAKRRKTRVLSRVRMLREEHILSRISIDFEEQAEQWYESSFRVDRYHDGV